MKPEEELREQMEALRLENQALRNAVNRPGKRNVIIVSEGSYQGHPTITFEAGGRPFTLGLRKAAVMLYCVEYVKRFVVRHKSEIKDWEIIKGSSTSGEPARQEDVQI